MTIGDVIEGNPPLQQGFEAWKRVGYHGDKSAAQSDLGCLAAGGARFDSQCAQMGLRRQTGSGQCYNILSLMFLQGLIELHNELLAPAKRENKEPWERLLPISFNRDKLIMITLNSHYYLPSRAGGSTVAFDFATVEEWILSDMLAGVYPISDKLSNYSDERIR
eukprot:sb/3472631/